MKTLGENLVSHLSGQATTVCRAWRLTRRDGLVLGFTEHDHDLDFAGTRFAAATGFDASALETTLGLASDTRDVAGAFSAEAITVKELRDGRYDGARVERFLVNWQAPEDHVLESVENIGEVVHDGNAFRAELRGIAHRLEEVRGRIYTRRCDADLGEARCGVDLNDARYRASATVSVVADALSAFEASGLETFEDGWFTFGKLTFVSGANAGLSVEVEAHAVMPDAEGGQGGTRVAIRTWLPLPNPIAAGDQFEVTAGCARSFDVCRNKFDNHLNFQGFPHIPGSDFAYGYADQESEHDGRPIVP